MPGAIAAFNHNYIQSGLIYLIIIISLFGIAAGRIPRFRMNRASIAFIGAALLVILGGLPLEKAFASIDLNTLILILSMMIITANLKLSGFFELAGNMILKKAGSPKKLLALLMVFSAVLSALFLNDTICIMFTPFVCILCMRSQRNPVPYLIALAISANIGSAATIIGNPQNMLIGAASGIPFMRFLLKMAVPSVLGCAAAYGIILACFRGEFSGTGKTVNPPGNDIEAAENALPFVTVNPPGDMLGSGPLRIRVYRPLLYKSFAAIAVMVAALVLNAPVTTAALCGAAILLCTRRINPEKVFRELDWTIIAFFGGLFVLTEGIASTGAFAVMIEKGMPLINENTAIFSVFAVLLSNLVSNVPAVMLLKPLAEFFRDQEKFWLIMAMASTYAGNLTLLGSVANLIVAEIARGQGIEIRFRDYLKAGLPVTIVTVAIGSAWLVFF